MSDTFQIGLPDAARHFGVPIRVLRRAIRAGKIPAPPHLNATSSLSAEWLNSVKASPNALSRSPRQQVAPFCALRGHLRLAQASCPCARLCPFSALRRSRLTERRRPRPLNYRCQQQLVGVGLEVLLATVDAMPLPYRGFGAASFLAAASQIGIAASKGAGKRGKHLPPPGRRIIWKTRSVSC